MMPLIIMSIVILLLSKGAKPETTRETINGISYIKIDKPTKTFTEQDAVEGLQYAKQKYGRDFARLLERIYRLETAHFKSGQYKGTGTPGMEYGKWGDWILQYWPSTIYLLKYTDPKRGPKWFLVAKDTKTFADVFYYYMNTIRDGNWATWNSMNAEKQEKYRNAVNSISNTIIT